MWLVYMCNILEGCMVGIYGWYVILDKIWKG